MKFPLVALPLVTVLLAGGAQAAKYDCTFDINQGAWLPERVILRHDEASGAVKVNDPLVQHFMGGPIEGKLSVDNARRRTFQWTVKGIQVGAQHASGIVVRMTVQKASHKAVVSSTVKGYLNTDRADGSCKVAK